MARSAFKLKSGNISGGSSFKQIGSSPVKLGWLKSVAQGAGKLYSKFKYGSRYADEVSEIITKGTNKMKPYTKKGKPRKNFTNETVSTGTSNMKSELSKLNPRKTTTRFKVARGTGVAGVIGSVIAKDNADGSSIEVYQPTSEQSPKIGRYSTDSINNNAENKEKKYVPSTYE